jgi:hypothetical protein
MKLLFVRYGGLSSVRQEGYDPSMPTFHAPPARRGIYAFVAQTVSRFLLSNEEFDPRRTEWVRDEAGNRVPSDSDAARKLVPDWFQTSYLTRLAKDGRMYLARHKKPKYFRYEGNLWHHLSVPRSEVLQEKGDWVLTSAESHRRAFRKAFHQRQYAQERAHPSWLLDEFEVFIEKALSPRLFSLGPLRGKLPRGERGRGEGATQCRG